MVREDVSKAISANLRRLFEVDRNITLDFVASSTGVPITTIHRAKSGVGRLQQRTALKLAGFIEDETQGQIRADRLMGRSRRKNFLDANLRGADLSGEDLRDCDFRGAQLSQANLAGAQVHGAKFDLAKMRGTNLAQVTGTASFRSAILDGANIQNVRVDWDMTGVLARNMTVRNVVFEECVRLAGADLSGADADWKDIVWRVIGSRTVGARLPKFDPREITEGFCDHLVLVRGLEVVLGVDLEKDEGDPDILNFAEFMLARESSLRRCYDGGAKRLLNRHPQKIKDVMHAWGMFDWGASQRLEMALYVRENCKTLDDYVALKNTKFYEDSWIPAPPDGSARGSKAVVEKYIHRAKRGQMMHEI